MTSWEESESWYDKCVGKEGHYYHQSLILKQIDRLLALKPNDSVLDLGCGQGVLARHLPKEIDYVGIDLSPSLIQQAKQKSKHTFLVADACQILPLEKKDFSAACLILSLQNMEQGEKAIQNAVNHLRPEGKLLLVLNHPCFRIPRQSNWGLDAAKKLQYRRMDSYMSSQKIPIQTHPSKGERSPMTYSFHHPLSTYTSWLKNSRCAIKSLEEWCSDKTSEGSKAKIENRARKEFPLFLAILAVRDKNS